MSEDDRARQLKRLAKLPRNPTHVARQSGFAWNVSTIGQALNIHRNTVHKKIQKAGLEPDGYVSNSPVYELSKVIPTLYGHPPKAPKDRNHE